MKKRAADPPTNDPEQLSLRYVPLSTVRRWERNPKRHDTPAIAESIWRHGFGDPPKYDSALEALVYGNGRTEALEIGRAEGRQPPRGVLPGLPGAEEDWLVPIIFGVDQRSREEAEAFGVAHNFLTLGPGVSFEASLPLRRRDPPALVRGDSSRGRARGLARSDAAPRGSRRLNFATSLHFRPPHSTPPLALTCLDYSSRLWGIGRENPMTKQAQQPPTFTPGSEALWHRSRQNLPPRPVLIIKPLGAKIRVLDLCEGDARHLIFRDVHPGNLTERR